MCLALNGLSLEMQVGFYSLIYIQLIMQPKQFEETRLRSPRRAATHTASWFNRFVEGNDSSESVSEINFLERGDIFHSGGGFIHS